ncbi:hypothetical protein L484_027996 [Morus notabilis]|uniref:Uncharacterized protein n=1 Tax=Morus notabilis TaxID=981085 RepID=W9SW71_9ROSA|nr:hypothetical protein L484_027996 [Morus notabilis]
MENTTLISIEDSLRVVKTPDSLQRSLAHPRRYKAVAMKTIRHNVCLYRARDQSDSEDDKEHEVVPAEEVVPSPRDATTEASGKAMLQSPRIAGLGGEYSRVRTSIAPVEAISEKSQVPLEGASTPPEVLVIRDGLKQVALEGNVEESPIGEEENITLNHPFHEEIRAFLSVLSSGKPSS